MLHPKAIRGQLFCRRRDSNTDYGSPQEGSFPLLRVVHRSGILRGDLGMYEKLFV